MTSSEKAALAKLKRSIRTLKTQQAKDRSIEKLKNLQATIRDRQPPIATDDEIRRILSQGSEGV